MTFKTQSYLQSLAFNNLNDSFLLFNFCTRDLLKIHIHDQHSDAQFFVVLLSATTIVIVTYEL